MTSNQLESIRDIFDGKFLRILNNKKHIELR